MITRLVSRVEHRSRGTRGKGEHHYAFTMSEAPETFPVNTKPTNVEQSILPIMEQDVSMQMAYVTQQRLDSYTEAVAHAVCRKSVFDKKVLVQKPGEVVFSKGQLVQIYRSNLDDTFKTECKILLKWSLPYHVATRNLNSYTLETLTGTPVNGRFSA